MSRKPCVYWRWCYGAERYLYFLQKYVRNRSKPEASIAQGYMYAEALGFMVKHLSLYPGWTKIWDPEDDDKNYAEVLEGAPIDRRLTKSELKEVHEFVLCNSAATESLREEYDLHHTAERRASRTRQIPPFSDWLDTRVDRMRAAGENVSAELQHLAQLPLPIVSEHRGMWAYGSHFRVEDKVYGNAFATYDLGVACVSTTLCQNSVGDRRPLQAKLKYVGVIRKIILLDYAFKTINVLQCNWICPNTMSRPTMRQDEHGFWMVRKDAFQAATADPYIMPVHASHVLLERLLRGRSC
ncbi:hypothetical protein M758_UG107600 [Ceratodon purpureus]|nr:hypothetical protein M758_UG107600 [Ceratodon purpureus]